MLWRRKLSHYPPGVQRYLYLFIVVLATTVLYYELYVQGSVSTKVIAQYHMSFRYFVGVLVLSQLFGAFASLLAGLADRWGRANLVTYGLLCTGLLIAFGVPNAQSRIWFIVFSVIVAFIEGIVLVATPALIRDFSPQLGRGSAMGFWTLGPVLGSLIVSEVSSHTLPDHPNWRFQFYVCGISGLVVFAIALFGLRELAPNLRDQLMVSLRDRSLIEAKAASIDTDAATRGRWRQMLKLNIVGPAFGISVYLLFYYMVVGFFVIYFTTQWQYDLTKANNLENWYWIADAIGLVIGGIISDLLRVRKPLMLIGALVSAAGAAIFAVTATRPATTYDQFAVLLFISSIFGGVAYTAWMAGYTETVEKRNPAATATGLAIWGWVLRLVVTVSFAIVPFAVSATSPLVDYGTQVGQYSTEYKAELATFAKIDPGTQAALGRNPNDQLAQDAAVADVAGQGITASDVARAQILGRQDAQALQTAQAIDPATQAALAAGPTPAAEATAVGDIVQKLHVTPQEALARLTALAQVPTGDLAFLASKGAAIQQAGTELTQADQAEKADPAAFAYLSEHGQAVTQAVKDSPAQWQRWWWVCFGAQIVFLPFIWLMTGRWSPRRARRDTREHEQAVQRELAELGG